MTSLQKYSEIFRVAQYECDAASRMTPGAVLRRAQQLATDHCEAADISADVYVRTHTAFLLAKVAVEWARPIPVGACIRAVTRPGAPVRAVYTRCTEFFEESTGDRLCAMDSRWVLVDTETRRILRTPPEELNGFSGLTAPYTLDVAVHKPGSLTPCGVQTATYTRCDLNGHLNNTVYADIACDCADAEALLARSVSRFAAVFHKEVPLGVSFDVLRGETDRGLYFCGQSEAGRHFEAELSLFAPAT